MSVDDRISIHNENTCESPIAQDYDGNSSKQASGDIRSRKQIFGFISRAPESRIGDISYQLSEYKNYEESEHRKKVDSLSEGRNVVSGPTSCVSSLERNQSELDSHGKEQIEESYGRWSSSEHDMFMKGLDLFGKDWRKIQTLVTTRTLVQIRTHAQKLFKKISQFKTSLKYEKNCADKRRSIALKRHLVRGRDVRSGSSLTSVSKLDSSMFEPTSKSKSVMVTEINRDEEVENKSNLFPRPIRSNATSTMNRPQPYFLLPLRQQEYYESLSSPDTSSLSQDKIRDPKADNCIPAKVGSIGSYISNDTCLGKSNRLSAGFSEAISNAVRQDDPRTYPKYVDMLSDLHDLKRQKLTSSCYPSQEENRNLPGSTFFSRNELAEEERANFQRQIHHIFNTAVSAGHEVMINYSLQLDKFKSRESRIQTRLSLLEENEKPSVEATRLMLLQEKSEIKSLSSRLRMHCEQQINQINQIIKEQHAIIFRMQQIENGLADE